MPTSNRPSNTSVEGASRARRSTCITNLPNVVVLLIQRREGFQERHGRPAAVNDHVRDLKVRVFAVELWERTSAGGSPVRTHRLVHRQNLTDDVVLCRQKRPFIAKNTVENQTGESTRAKKTRENTRDVPTAPPAATPNKGVALRSPPELRMRRRSLLSVSLAVEEAL